MWIEALCGRPILSARRAWGSCASMTVRKQSAHAGTAGETGSLRCPGEAASPWTCRARRRNAGPLCPSALQFGRGCASPSCLAEPWVVGRIDAHARAPGWLDTFPMFLDGHGSGQPATISPFFRGVQGNASMGRHAGTGCAGVCRRRRRSGAAWRAALSAARRQAAAARYAASRWPLRKTATPSTPAVATPVPTTRPGNATSAG